MRTIHDSIEIAVPPERAYEFMTHPQNLPGVWPSLVEVSDVEHRPNGAHAFNYKYKMAGVMLHGRSHTVQVEPNRLVVSQTEGGVTSNFRWTYEPTKRGTQLSCKVEYTIPTPVIGRLAEAIVARLNEHELNLVLRNAKVALEEGKPATAAVGAMAH